MDIHAAALKLLRENLALKAGEKITVVTDRESCPVFDSVCAAAREMGGRLAVARLNPSRTHSEPVPAHAKIFSVSDIIVAATDKSISHCPEIRLARRERGTRVISMVGVDEKLFLKAMSADRKEIAAISGKLAAKLKKCKEVRITTPAGTDVRIKSEPREVSVDDGDSTKKGSLNNVPFGEACMLPVSSADGVVAIDFSRAGVEPGDGVQVTVKGGRIIGWNNIKAKAFVDYLRGIDGEKATMVVELGLGTNPGHKKLIGNIIHDEKMWGSAHIAFGGFGERRPCKIHEDVILLRPTVLMDGRTVIKDGKIL